MVQYLTNAFYFNAYRRQMGHFILASLKLSTIYLLAHLPGSKYTNVVPRLWSIQGSQDLAPALGHLHCRKGRKVESGL